MFRVPGDLRYALRWLRNQPAFSILAVLTLALGIGAVTAIFSIVDTLLLEPLPYRESDRAVSIRIYDANTHGRWSTGFRVPEFLYLKRENHVFEDVMAGGNEDIIYENGSGTEQFYGGFMTPNAFSFVAAPPLIGRGLTADDAKPDAPPVFVMSYKLWAGRFNRDRNILGCIFVLNGIPTTLVGIMPARFTLRGTDLWRPFAPESADGQSIRRYLSPRARLKPGVTLAQAIADLDLILHRRAKAYPKEYPEKFTIRVLPWQEDLVASYRTTLYMFAAAVGLLLLIACANVANMLLARASAREREIAIRASMGASRWRLIRQLAVESLLLAFAGSVVGCFFAWTSVKALLMILPRYLLFGGVMVYGVNRKALLFSLAAAILSTLLFGFVPALGIAKQDLIEPLKSSGKGAAGGRGGKLRSALVILEVTLSLVLLTGAGLLIRTFVALQSVNLGFNPDNVLAARIPLPADENDDAAGKHRFFQSLLTRFSAVPGIAAAAETSGLPPYDGIPTPIEIDGKSHTEAWNALYQLASEGYFRVLELRLLQGRIFTADDVNAVRKVAVVNQSFARRYFGSASPIGSHVQLRHLEETPRPPVKGAVFEIVGVVADARNQGIQEPAMPEAIVPYTVTGAFERGILVRTAGPPEAMLNTIARQIWAVDKNVPLVADNTGTLRHFLRTSYDGPRLNAAILAVFAAIGLLLVTIGVYSVISYAISRRTHEIGIRMALGAARRDVRRMVLLSGLRLLAAGITAGLLVSFLAARLMRSQIFGVSPLDPVTLAGGVIIILFAGLAACYFPARRATSVDPNIALRYE